MFIRQAMKTGGLVLVLVLFAAACSNGTNADTPASDKAVSSTANPEFGKILTDSRGRTLYLFDEDKPIKPESSCNGDCAKAWPPVLTSEGTNVGADLDPAKLAEVTRADGTVQLTYNTWPLYRFGGDTAPGMTNGQGIGGTWHVAGIDGKPITAAAAAPAPTADSGGSYN
jgi:predicted lipoprotein with Yx(FWY)xxD motif